MLEYLNESLVKEFYVTKLNEAYCVDAVFRDGSIHNIFFNGKLEFSSLEDMVCYSDCYMQYWVKAENRIEGEIVLIFALGDLPLSSEKILEKYPEYFI